MFFAKQKIFTDCIFQFFANKIEDYFRNNKSQLLVETVILQFIKMAQSKRVRAIYQCLFSFPRFHFKIKIENEKSEKIIDGRA